MKRRFIKAVAIILSVACALSVGTFAVASAQEYTVQAGQTYANKLWERMQKGEAANDAMKSVGFKSLEQNSSAVMPSWLRDEVLAKSSINKFDIYGNSDLSIVGFRVDYSINEAYSLVLKDFSDLEWVASGSQSTSTVTLEKQKGECRWMMVEFVEFGNQTSVVLRIKRA